MIQKPKYLDINGIDMPEDLPKIPFYLEPYSYEIAYALFEACNLHCKFCFEGHRNNKVDPEQIKQAPQHIYNEMVPELSKYPNITNINIRLWGGELFFDALPDTVFDAYKYLIDTCKELFSKNYPHLTLKFSWLTNGVWKRWDRIKEILDRSKGVLGFSYDPADRFPSEKAEQLMVDNVWRAYNEGYFSNLSITLTKQTVKQYISGKHNLLNFPPLIGIDVNYYTANPGWETQILNDEDLYQFFKWALKHRLFNINIVNNLIAPGFNLKQYHRGHYCDCKTCKQYSNGFCTVDCAKRASILPHKMFYGKYDPIITEENVSDVKLSMGILKRGCLTCPYYDLCQKMCWITVVFEGYKPDPVCPFARIYQEMLNDKELLKDYLEYREKKYGKDVRA